MKMKIMATSAALLVMALTSCSYAVDSIVIEDGAITVDLDYLPPANIPATITALPSTPVATLPTPTRTPTFVVETITPVRTATQADPTPTQEFNPTLPIANELQRVTTDRLNLRSFPALGSATFIRTLEIGERLTVDVNSSIDGWYQVTVVTTGEVGWVSSNAQYTAPYRG